MAIGQISGPLLKSNLERNGVNLSVETDLLYLDVINGRVGIKNAAPQHALDIIGNTNIDGSLFVGNIQTTGAIFGESTLVLDPFTYGGTDGLVSILGSLTVNGYSTIVHQLEADSIDLVYGSVGIIRGPSTIQLDPATHGDNTGTVIIDGDVVINGTTTTINSTTVSITDKNIVIGSGNIDRSFADQGGITIDLGIDGSATLTYQAASDSFVFNKPLILDAGVSTGGAVQTTDINLTGAIYGPAVLLLDPEAYGDGTGTVSIDGDLIISGPNTTLNDISINGNLTTTGTIFGPSSFTIDPAAYGTNTGIVNILGDLSVTGTTTSMLDLTVRNITTTGNLLAPASYTIDPYTGTSDPGLLTVAGNLHITGDSLTLDGVVYGPANTIIDPSPYNNTGGTVSINGDLSVIGLTTTVNNFVADNITTEGYLRGPSTFIIDPVTYGDYTGLVDVYGNLTVRGNTTNLNNLNVNDITVNGNLSVPAGFSLTPAAGGSLTVEGDLNVSGDTTFDGTLYGPSTFIVDPATHGDNTGTVQIAGNLTVAGATATLPSLNVGNIETTTGIIYGPATLVLDPFVHEVELGLVRVKGNLQVDGASTSLHSLSVGNITTTGYLRGPTTLTIDPETFDDDAGLVDILGAVAVGSSLTVDGSTTLNALGVGNITTTGYLRGPSTLLIDPVTYGDDSGLVRIAGDLDVNGSTTAVKLLEAENIVTTGYLRGPATFTIDPAVHGDNTGTVVIAGNLQVNGTTTTTTPASFSDINLTGRINGPTPLIIDPATHGDNTGVVEIYGDLTVNGTTTTLVDLNVRNITSTGYLRGPATFTIDPATHGDNTGTVVIAGNLQVDGTTTTINSTVVTIDDKLIVVASGSSNKTAATGSGLQVDLGTDGSANLTYDGISGAFKVDQNFDVYGQFKVQDAATQDSIIVKGSGSGNNSYSVTIKSNSLSANRIVTLPNADVTLVSGTMVPTSRTLTISTSNGIAGGQSALDLSTNRSWSLSLTGQSSAFHNLATSGIVTRTAANTITARTITSSGEGISVTNGDGISGNPLITLNSTSASTGNTVVYRNINGDFSANIITASLAGNADTATKLATTVNINSEPFDGSNSITITANTPESLTRGSYLVGGQTTFNGSLASTWSVNASTTGVSNVVARDNSGNFSAGTITASLAGNANTASKFFAPAKINGVDYDGSAPITITANTTNALSPGSYISGSAFNGNLPQTWNINGSNSGTNNLVARDISGNFSAGTITASLVSTSHLVPNVNSTFNLGSTLSKWSTVYADIFTGTATQAKYADLAENYLADAYYEPGTVLVFGGQHDVTVSTEADDRKVAGVVSTNPSYLMDSELQGDYIVAMALQGKIPCNVIGPVEKGDMLVTSNFAGFAVVNNDPKVGTVIGKALESKPKDFAGTIMIVVGRD